MVLGNYGRARGMSERTRAAVDTVWGYAAFVLNSLVFLLIGLTTPIADVLDDAGAVAAAACITLVARAVAVYLLLLPVRFLHRPIPFLWQHIVVWSGMRGAVAVALALSIGEGGVGGLGRVRTLVYGVVLLSIVVQGATVAPLITRLIGRDRHTARPRAGSRGGGRRRRPSSAPAGGGNQPPG
jgi:CPA1 family monovalent cation:H+ antiporter